MSTKTRKARLARRPWSPCSASSMVTQATPKDILSSSRAGASCSDFVATNLDRIASRTALRVSKESQRVSSEVFECIRHQTKREVSSDMAIRSALQAAFRTTEHNFFQYANRLGRVSRVSRVWRLEAGPAAAWANAGRRVDQKCRLRTECGYASWI